MPDHDGFDYERLYAYRHAGVDQATRARVWVEIANYLFDVLGRPDRVLDPAAGRGEFINAIASRDRWVVDLVDYEDARYDHGVTVVVGDVLSVELPDSYFDAVFASNLLEHFERQRDVAHFLQRMRQAIAPRGCIAPNFRYCSRSYFDCADHTLALTHTAVAEHVHAAGFEVERVVARFLPYSFRGLLPPSARLTRTYLQVPLAWRFLGKQFLVIARRPD
jgi:hypothetical protein